MKCFVLWITGSTIQIWKIKNQDSGHFPSIIFLNLTVRYNTELLLMKSDVPLMFQWVWEKLAAHFSRVEFYWANSQTGYNGLFQCKYSCFQVQQSSAVIYLWHRLSRQRTLKFKTYPPNDLVVTGNHLISHKNTKRKLWKRSKEQEKIVSDLYRCVDDDHRPADLPSSLWRWGSPPWLQGLWR